MEENKDIIENEPVKESAPKTSAEGPNLLRDIMEIVESTVITVFLIVLLFTYILHPVNIVGGSMEDTLKTDDRIFMSTVYFDISYGDIIVIDNDAAYLLDESGELYKKNIDGSSLKECIIKRVIACGGQTLDIVDGVVYVDGKALDEPYTKGYTGGGSQFTYPLTVPEGYYFVMGDHRDASTDSRFDTVGFIKKDQIYGKAIIRYSPFSDFKFLFNSWKKSSDE